jgi:hypothetical protein
MTGLCTATARKRRPVSLRLEHLHDFRFNGNVGNVGIGSCRCAAPLQAMTDSYKENRNDTTKFS